MFSSLFGQGVSRFRELRSAELKQRLQDVEPPLVIDVREPSEFRQGHIPGAKSLPLGKLQFRLGELDPAQAYVVVCLSGARSRQACGLLTQSGFTEVTNLLGGMRSWDGPVTR